MKKVKLGSSDLMVSEVCLGSMTWGEQNTQAQGAEQIEYALDQGINFIDTAELYAVPPRPETYGLTEKYIGQWLNQNQQRREEVIIASKVVGPGIPWIRDGAPVTAQVIKKAIDDSLTRLQTDYIDLYQLHWPNRSTAHFSKHWPGDLNPCQVNVEKEREGMLSMLRALDDSIKAGKIRHCGLSNETPWGINEYLRLAQQFDLPKMVSIQNEFSLLHLKDSPYLIENCVFNDVAYLPWSPLAGGALSGKYANGKVPEGSRWSIPQRNGLFRSTPNAHKAVAAYQEVAARHGLSLAQLSLAWLYQLNGVTSTIIGATSMQQLKEDIGAYHLVLSDEVLNDVSEVIKQYPAPF